MAETTEQIDAADEWADVSESLPVDERSVRAISPQWFSPIIAYCEGGTWFKPGHGYVLVTRWQPFAAPPKR